MRIPIAMFMVAAGIAPAHAGCLFVPLSEFRVEDCITEPPAPKSAPVARPTCSSFLLARPAVSGPSTNMRHQTSYPIIRGMQ